MQLLDGKLLSSRILDHIKSQLDVLPQKPNLHVILVGDDPQSLKYVSLKEKKCREVGINFTLHHKVANTPQPELLDLIDSLNQNQEVSGFFIQLPLPSPLDRKLILNSIAPQKDVDGLTAGSPFLPAVDLGIIALLQHYGITFTNQQIAIVNDSDLIGQPLKKQLEKEGAVVNLCNETTSDLSSATRAADIVISATGVKNLITPSYIKEGAVVVDVAGGDVDFDSVAPKTSFITPTFGGVGPMTIACLLKNTLLCFQTSKCLPKNFHP